MLFCANNVHSLCCQNMVRIVFYLYHSFNALRILFCFNNTVAWNRYQKHHMLQAGVRAYNDAQNIAILWKHIHCIFYFFTNIVVIKYEWILSFGFKDKYIIWQENQSLCIFSYWCVNRNANYMCFMMIHCLKIKHWILFFLGKRQYSL